MPAKVPLPGAPLPSDSDQTSTPGGSRNCPATIGDQYGGDRRVTHGRLRRSCPMSCMWLGAIASTTRGARDDAQTKAGVRAEDRRGRGVRPARRYTARTGSCSALRAPMYGRPGGSPVFLVFRHRRAGGPLANAEQVRRGGTPSGTVMGAPRSVRDRVARRSRRGDPGVRWSAWRCSSGQRTRAGPEGPPPASTRHELVSALESRKANGGGQRVHSASTRSASTVFRPSRPYTPFCCGLQGFRGHS